MNFFEHDSISSNVGSRRGSSPASQNFGLPIVIGRPQPAVLGGADMPGSFLVVAAFVIAVGDPHPLSVPALFVTGDHARRRLEAFADRAAALLRLAQPAPKLVGHHRIVRPLLPAEWLVVRFACRHGHSPLRRQRQPARLKSADRSPWPPAPIDRYRNDRQASRHELLPDGRVVVLAMIGAGLFFADKAQGRIDAHWLWRNWRPYWPARCPAHRNRHGRSDRGTSCSRAAPLSVKGLAIIQRPLSSSTSRRRPI